MEQSWFYSSVVALAAPDSICCSAPPLEARSTFSVDTGGRLAKQHAAGNNPQHRGWMCRHRLATFFQRKHPGNHAFPTLALHCMPRVASVLAPLPIACRYECLEGTCRTARCALVLRHIYGSVN
jgi:hypothetical protein